MWFKNQVKWKGMHADASLPSHAHLPYSPAMVRGHFYWHTLYPFRVHTSVFSLFHPFSSKGSMLCSTALHLPFRCRSVSCSLSATAQNCKRDSMVPRVRTWGSCCRAENSEVSEHTLCFSVFPFIDVVPGPHMYTVSLWTTEAGPVILKERKMDQFGYFLSF